MKQLRDENAAWSFDGFMQSWMVLGKNELASSLSIGMRNSESGAVASGSGSGSIGKVLVPGDVNKII